MRKKYACDCCGYLTMSEPRGSHSFCEICGWHDDGILLENREYISGANEGSLSSCQTRYRNDGYANESVKELCRKPNKSDVFMGALKNVIEVGYCD